MQIYRFLIKCNTRNFNRLQFSVWGIYLEKHLPHYLKEYLCFLPQCACAWDKFFRHLTNSRFKTSRAKPTTSNNACTIKVKLNIYWSHLVKKNASQYITKNFINRCVWRKCTVKYWELSLQSLRYVISPSSWVYHSTDKLNIHNCCEFTRFIKIVETTHFHCLSCDFIGDL